MKSILEEELTLMLQRLGEPKMFRPDRGLLYGQRMLAEIEAMEREGLLRPDESGGLVYNRTPPQEGCADVTLVMFNLGIVWKPVADRLKAAGRLRGASPEA